MALKLEIQVLFNSTPTPTRGSPGKPGRFTEARGDNKLAADYYRKVINFVRTRPDQYEPGFDDTFHRLIQKLDPPSTD